MLKIQFAKRYPWDLHKAVILKLYADRIGTYFFFFFLYVCVCAYVRVCVGEELPECYVTLVEGKAKNPLLCQ